jgi:hypothetical protein
VIEGSDEKNQAMNGSCQDRSSNLFSGDSEDTKLHRPREIRGNLQKGRQPESSSEDEGEKILEEIVRRQAERNADIDEMPNETDTGLEPMQEKEIVEQIA